MLGFCASILALMHVLAMKKLMKISIQAKNCFDVIILLMLPFPTFCYLTKGWNKVSTI